MIIKNVKLWLKHFHLDKLISCNNVWCNGHQNLLFYTQLTQTRCNEVTNVTLSKIIVPTNQLKSKSIRCYLFALKHTLKLQVYFITICHSKLKPHRSLNLKWNTKADTLADKNCSKHEQFHNTKFLTLFCQQISTHPQEWVSVFMFQQKCIKSGLRLWNIVWRDCSLNQQ